MLSNGLFEEGQARVAISCFLVLPPLIVEQIILETAEAHAIAAEDIAGFEAVAQQTIDQELIAVRQQTSVSTRVLGIQVAFGGVRDEAEGERLRRHID